MSPLNHRLITHRYFFPIVRPPSQPWYVTVPCAQLACHRHVHDPDALTVLFFHGNGEVVLDYLPWFPDLLAGLGVNLVLAEYPGYGGSTGTPQLVQMLNDGPAIFDALQLPAERVVVFGRSVGSLYAMHLAAARPGMAGLIIESGIADVLERLLLRVRPDEIGLSMPELVAAVERDLSPRDWLQRHRGPSLFLHARRDDLVSVEHAEQLHRWACPPRRLSIFEAGDHNTIYAANQAAYVRALRDFLGTL